MVTAKQLDAQSIHEAIARLAVAIAARHPTATRLLLLGIADGGMVLAQRLAAMLRSGASSQRASSGAIDISFHRDDIDDHPIPKEFVPTFIPQDVSNATVILVDDVLHSGRTVKAALDELFDHGRPARVELAVLIDRGGRRLPIAADYCGLTIAATENQRVFVQLDPNDPGRDFVRIDHAAPAADRKSKKPKTEIS
ncbi:MAG: bifunctional pyr operon transcriptional regulator/uracil phosphoribosyltransferase PyrR [Opitutaceae bacterium]|nr:bifunctional pyr operon transcriptional regulator/uracil phosphoribosyltransferase PyrR [Opitutaceae bacterium]